MDLTVALRPCVARDDLPVDADLHLTDIAWDSHAQGKTERHIGVYTQCHSALVRILR